MIRIYKLKYPDRETALSDLITKGVYKEIAFFTEIYDEFFKSKFDLLDLIATQLGFFLALLIKLIIYFFY